MIPGSLFLVQISRVFSHAVLPTSLTRLAIWADGDSARILDGFSEAMFVATLPALTQLRHLAWHGSPRRRPLPLPVALTSSLGTMMSRMPQLQSLHLV